MRKVRWKSLVARSLPPRVPRGSDSAKHLGGRSIVVSIHAPHAGSDATLQHSGRLQIVSIHAPHAGSDVLEAPENEGWLRFNPRSPRGERPAAATSPALRMGFQSTLPTRGATVVAAPPVLHQWFQSTLPTRGATILSFPDLCAAEFQSTLPTRGATVFEALDRLPLVFQSTLPTRGATRRRMRCANANVVSIHAPHAGSDVQFLASRADVHSVSIHAPHAGSDSRLRRDRPTAPVSIHAPHAGSDSAVSGMAIAADCFNPRSPRGERRQSIEEPSIRRCFNPRSPRGERRGLRFAGLQRVVVSIHAPHAGSDCAQ